jgi:1,2-diacylglycerol 3-beta-glucosyltransferase
MSLLISSLTLFLVVVALSYSVFLLYVGHRRGNEKLSALTDGAVIPEHLVFLVPCLNEELVIADTVAAALRQSGGAVVFVIDDASQDNTVAVAELAIGGRGAVVRRTLPQARQGKSSALNFGFTALLNYVEERGWDPSTVCVCVLDGDGRLSDGAGDLALRRFANPFVGGLQLPVRIMNRESLLGRMQDIEFWGGAAVAQLGRMRSETVSLGGNGQFTRLTALLSLGDQPWNPTALTEDLDLAMRLAAKGWKLVSEPNAFVAQQGVETVRQLIKQRTRWFQGHLACAKYAPEIWRSPKVPTLSMLELVTYLAIPWAFVLPWSILIHLGLIQMAQAILSPIGEAQRLSPLTSVLFLFSWYVLSFAPFFGYAFLYRRRAKELSRLRAFFLANLFFLYGYVSFLACWKALFRLCRGEGNWVKTERSAESAKPEPSALVLEVAA